MQRLTILSETDTNGFDLAQLLTDAAQALNRGVPIIVGPNESFAFDFEGQAWRVDELGGKRQIQVTKP